MAKRTFISDYEMIFESSESGLFYPKVLTGRPGLIPSEDPQGWNFCIEDGKPVRFPTFKDAEEYLLDRTDLTKRKSTKN